MVMTDFRRTAFPAHMPCGSDALAEHFDALNDEGGADGAGGAGGAGLAGRVAALRAAHPGSPVVSASHFVPWLALMPEKRYLMIPSLNRAIGSRPLAARILDIRPDAHVFGHTHFGWDAA